MALRTYHDPLHHGITLDGGKPEEAMVMALIDSAPFQRLRRIKQLGPASLTFHGAESSRFTHSLGVFHIARKAINHLEEIDNNLKPFRGILYAAALLHDIGHSPFSHTGEEMFGLNHEIWTALIIKQHPEIKQILNKFIPGSIEEVAACIDSKNTCNPVIKSLVSSQLDCDRLDYLMRDSYSTGTKYGQLDLERIITGLTISPDGELAISPKGLMAVEHYLVLRNLMYRSVYNHRINEVCSWILGKIIATARELGSNKVWADTYISKWIWETNQIDLQSFLANDDTRIGYHISRWGEEAPTPLAELSKRFLNRDLLKASEISYLSNEKQLETLVIARKLSERANCNPDICCGLRQTQLESYLPYKKGLRLWDGTNLSPLEISSELITGLINRKKTTWLIYPKEIDQELDNKLKNDLYITSLNNIPK